MKIESKKEEELECVLFTMRLDWYYVRTLNQSPRGTLNQIVGIIISHMIQIQYSGDTIQDTQYIEYTTINIKV